MQEDTQNEHLTDEENPDQSQTAPSLTEPSEPTHSRVPAATASSYRDIIAERLARQGGGHQSGSTPSPMAHASDVERAPKPVLAPEKIMPVGAGMIGHPRESDDRSSASEALPARIEASTKLQEMSAGEAGAKDGGGENSSSVGSMSGRDRARMRQQERAALRSGGSRRSQQESEEPELEDRSFAAEESEETTSEPASTSQEKDVIAGRLARKGGDRSERSSGRPERPRDEPRRDEPRREESRSEEPQREERRRDRPQPMADRPREAAREPRPAPAVPGQLEGLTIRPVRPAAREREDVRRREPTTPRRSEPTEFKAPRKPEDKVSADRSSASDERSSGAQGLAIKLGISVIIPLYNEQDSLRELTAALKQQCVHLAGPKYEILYVNDGSTDHSGEILQDILATSSRVSVLTFRRNLGKSAALAAGFAEAQYGIVITMDADLQDDPREFVNLLGKLDEGYDLVSGWKKKRHDPMSKTGPSKFFNAVTSFFSGIRLHDFNCGLKAYRKEVTDSLQVYGELHRYLPALAYWQGFRVTEIPVTHHPRKFGKSKFGSSRFFKGFLDLLSIVFTNRYGKRPLHLFGTVGTLMAFAGFVIDIWLTVEWALGLTSLSNRPILLLGLLLILVGVQLISLGLLGEMIVKNAASRSNLTYQKEKGRPSAEARERRASRAARVARVGSRPPSGERRGPPRR